MNESASDRGAAIRALMLWVIVAGGLVYGIVNTASEVVHLFGG